MIGLKLFFWVQVYPFPVFSKTRLPKNFFDRGCWKIDSNKSILPLQHFCAYSLLLFRFLLTCHALSTPLTQPLVNLCFPIWVVTDLHMTQTTWNIGKLYLINDTLYRWKYVSQRHTTAHSQHHTTHRFVTQPIPSLTQTGPKVFYQIIPKKVQ